MLQMNFFWLLTLLIVFNVIVWGFLLIYMFGTAIKRFFYSRFRRSKYLEAKIISDNRQLISWPVLMDKLTFPYKGERYVVDKQCIYFSGRFGSVPESYYMKGNPSPLNLLSVGIPSIITNYIKSTKKPKNSDGEEIQPMTVSLNSSNLKEALDQKFIKDLMLESRTFFLILIATGLTFLVSLVIAAKVFGFIEFEYSGAQSE